MGHVTQHMAAALSMLPMWPTVSVTLATSSRSMHQDSHCVQISTSARETFLAVPTSALISVEASLVAVQTDTNLPPIRKLAKVINLKNASKIIVQLFISH